MTPETIGSALVNAGPAGVMAAALLFTVRTMLRFFASQSKAEREERRAEVSAILEAHKETSRAIVGELRLIRQDFRDGPSVVPADGAGGVARVA